MTSSAGLVIVQLLATPGGNWGGMETHTADLSEELARRGHQVHVIAHRNYWHRFAEPVRFHPLPVQRSRRNPFLKRRLKQILNTLQPSVLHAHGNKAAALLSAAHSSGPPTLGTVHGTKTNHNAFQKLDGVITVSEGPLKALSHPNTKLIRNGIALRDQNRGTRHPVPENKPFALAIGRLEPVKQFDKLIDAWAKIDPPLPLYILGDGSEAARLKNRIDRLGVGDSVKLPGYENNPSAWLERAAVCVISSQREGFPYALVESMLAQCPVLSTPVNGATELLPEASLAETTSLEDLQALLDNKLYKLDELKQSQKSCFQLAAQELTLDAMACHTEAFYRELIARHRNV